MKKCPSNSEAKLKIIKLIKGGPCSKKTTVLSSVTCSKYTCTNISLKDKFDKGDALFYILCIELKLLACSVKL